MYAGTSEHERPYGDVKEVWPGLSTMLMSKRLSPPEQVEPASGNGWRPRSIANLSQRPWSMVSATNFGYAAEFDLDGTHQTFTLPFALPMLDHFPKSGGLATPQPGEGPNMSCALAPDG